MILGLTGSIGMGKSTTAQMFADLGVPVWDADATVHALYAPGGAAVAPIAARFPAVRRNGAIDRTALRSALKSDPSQGLSDLNTIVHPLVAQSRADWLARQTKGLVVLDVPLLFETGGDRFCDKVAVVSTDAATQRARIFARGTMTEADLEMILSQQMPDADKRALADYIIPTDNIESARAAVAAIVEELG